MTQEEKDLLLKDLSTRLPYGVKIWFAESNSNDHLQSIWYDNLEGWQVDGDNLSAPVYAVKPYLFPLSSMTEWQDRELEILMKNSIESCGMLSPYDCLEMERFFNENHLDWRGLIPMGLANDATGLNIY
jgi:hypothetical protein